MKIFWITGFLGLIIILINFLGLTYQIKSAFLMATGIIICFFSFREIIRGKISKTISERNTQIIDENKKLIQ